MTLWLTCALAFAGEVYEVRLSPEGLVYRQVGETGIDHGPIVTWPDQPLELVVVADLSGSMLQHLRYVDATGDTIEALFEAMVATAVPGDRIGVTAFATRPQRWIPLGALDRPNLAGWIARYGPPEIDPAREVRFDPELAWSPMLGAPAPPDARALEGGDTDAARAIRAAIAELRRGDPHALKAIVLLWDGGHNAFEELAPALDRAWANEIHVWSVSPVRPIGPLVTRGGGDAFVTRDLGPWVAERIVEEMRFPDGSG